MALETTAATATASASAASPAGDSCTSVRSQELGASAHPPHPSSPQKQLAEAPVPLQQASHIITGTSLSTPHAASPTTPPLASPKHGHGDKKSLSALDTAVRQSTSQQDSKDDGNSDKDDKSPLSAISTATTAVSPTAARHLETKSLSPQIAHQHQHQHQHQHTQSDLPRQTILKAWASSVARANKPEALPLAGTMASAGGSANVDHQLLPGPKSSSTSNSACASKKLADALNSLVLSNSVATPTTAIPILKSPCFYHQRFDDAVNIDKVLDEIKNDDSMSHSRLVQTAVGVREVSKQLQRRPIKRAVRNVMIVTKARDTNLVYLTKELATWLLSTPRYGSDVGINVFVDFKLRHSKRFDAPGIIAQDPRFEHMLKYWTPDLCWNQPDQFDLVLTLGGDGTVLFTSWLFQRVVPPVLSFSLGSLGFMTTFEFEKYKEHLSRVMGDDGMKINLRMRFTCTVWRAGSPGGEMTEGEQFEVLNELVIDRGPSPYVSNLELYGDDELLTVVQADGCIFSTPTGSTAYSLSAGGSLVHPDIPAILLTPICPHTLSFRPMVLSDTMALRVAVPRNSRATAYCAFDGKGRIELRQGDHVTITASQYPFPTVTRTDTEWFDSVSRTLRWNVRAAAQKPFDTSELTTPDGEKDDIEEWDIDTDSGFYASEENSVAASPIRRQMLEM